MIDTKVLREDPEAVRESQRRRNEDPTIVDRWLEADRAWREANVAYDTLRGEQKTAGAVVGPLQRAVKQASDDSAKASAQAELDAALAGAKDLSDRVKQAESDRDAADAEAAALLAALSNVIDLDAPVGGEDDFVVLEHAGTPRDFAAEGFTPRDHVELGEILGAVDIERGAKVSGSRFYYLTGVGALLEMALVNHAFAMAQTHDFTPMIPPALVRPAAMEGTGFLGQAAENVYRLEADDMYLVGTSEVPLAAYHSDEILDIAGLPKRYVAFSPCYRREAGSHGKDTRGIFRVHWFDKVEMFSYCPVEESYDEHRRLLGFEREYLDSLELPYRVIDVASGDLGSSAARKFDCEAWVPTQDRYREVTSTSNCTTFQSRRLRIRGREADGGVTPIATLNGTLVAITRTIVALFENHQNADGSVRVPVALQPYLGGREVLEPR